MVTGLSPIAWEDQAWDNLVLPEERKDLLQAVVKRQRKVGNVDLIKGKGEGTTFLLYGPPGTGKTLTAEAMAEVFHKPLYIMSAGEMGTTPEVLESKFSEALGLCARWDCLCLVDEADTFLEQRRGSDILRNALVCVMLRLLEYHPGVMFLTTNRAKGIDAAVQSRLTLALRYEPLDVNARRQVWSNLLHNCTGYLDVDLEPLAAAPLNGRQIKNCIRLSLALAVERGEPLSQQLLHSTLETVCLFQRDLQDEDENTTAAFQSSSQSALLWALAAAHRECETLRAENAALRAEFRADAAGSAVEAVRAVKGRET
jgi:SpoVK/Ycf46/Vps4 family AAA+-type ATPase